MKNYRIVKETKSKTGKISFIIEEEKRFLWWKWWAISKGYHYGGFSFDARFAFISDAELELKKLTENTKREIIG